MHECEYSGCNYQTNRKDNFDRHKLTHVNEKVVCDCGVVVSPSALERHKNNSCMLKIRSSVKICAQTQGTTIAKVQTTVRMCTQDDGSVKIHHGPINIDGVSFVLVPEDALNALNSNEEKEEEQSHGVNCCQSK